MSVSISCSIRYSRVRSAAFFGRRGVTVRFSIVGVTSFRCILSIEITEFMAPLFGLQPFYEQCTRERGRRTGALITLPPHVRGCCSRAPPRVPVASVRVEQLVRLQAAHLE